MLPNIIAYPVILFAVLRIGAIAVNLNPLYTATETQELVRDCAPKFMFAWSDSKHTVNSCAKDIERIFLVCPGDYCGFKGKIINFIYYHFISKRKPHTYSNYTWFSKILGDCVKARAAVLPYVRSSDPALLQYTSGTTGKCKAVLLTHKNLISAIEASQTVAAKVVQTIQCDSQLRVLHALPYYHVYGLAFVLMMTIANHGCGILIPDPRKTKSVIKILQRHKPHIFPAVNTLFQKITEQPNFANIDFSNLRCGLSGGMALNDKVANRWETITKTPIFVGYGLSESTGLIACAHPKLIKTSTGYRLVHDENAENSVGKPLDDVELKIVPLAGSTLTETGDLAGEICVKGPQVIESYVNDPDHESHFTKDGFFRTGDHGYMKNGYLYLSGRLKNMIIISGFNVYPSEVEKVIRNCDKVHECAIICKTDVDGREVVKAIVEKENGSSLEEKEIRQYCESHLAPYKRPKIIEITDSIPRSPIGKVLTNGF